MIIAEAPVGPTAVRLIPGVTLASGRNDIQASILGPAGETERSSVVTWVLDQAIPKITIISPKDNAAVTTARVKIKGKTQARSAVVLRNDANGATASAQADTDGLFQLDVAVAAGVNGVTITATDPAGNANSLVLTLRKGSGKMIVSLTGTVYRFTASKLPRDATFTVTVTGPDGKPVAGAIALFTVTVPGLEAIVSAEIPTGSNGTASFSTQIPKGAMAGTGLASVLVTAADSSTGTDRQVLTVS
jgi:Glucodextranase, domain B